MKVSRIRRLSYILLTLNIALAVTSFVYSRGWSPSYAVFAQYNNSSQQALLDRCAQVGLSPKNCTEQELLNRLRICIGGPGMCPGDTRIPPTPLIQFPLVIVVIGSGIAFGIGVISVWWIKRRKGSDQSFKKSH